MEPKIIRQDLGLEFYTEEKCHILEVSNSRADPEMSIARARVVVGETTCWHRLKTSTERYYILEGIGRVEIGGLPVQEVKPGDVVIIPSMCAQRISNIGIVDLVFLAICTPPFQEDDYEDIENLLL